MTPAQSLTIYNKTPPPEREGASCIKEVRFRTNKKARQITRRALLYERFTSSCRFSLRALRELQALQALRA